jgi:predicted negative regulator of RcsB-dependent stress response
MIETVLVIVIIAQGVLIGWLDYNNRKERKSMLNAILSKDTQDMVNLELADKTKIEASKEEQPEFTETSNISDEEYAKLIKETV